jgi:hypothetical protein
VEFRKFTDQPLTLRGGDYAHAVQALNKAIDRLIDRMGCCAASESSGATEGAHTSPIPQETNQVSLSDGQKVGEVPSQKYSFEDKLCGYVMHVGRRMESVPKDVIIWVGHDSAGRGIEGGTNAVREAKAARVVDQRHENRVDIHKFDADSMQKGKLW